MKQENYLLFVNGLQTKIRTATNEEFYCIKDDLPKEVEEAIRSVVLDRDDHDLDLTYKMVNRALKIMYDTKLEDLKEFDIYEYDGTIASVYTQELLSYLSIWNEDEITEHVNSLGFSISLACGYWYDEQVKEVFNALRDKVLA